MINIIENGVVENLGFFAQFGLNFFQNFITSSFGQQIQTNECTPKHNHLGRVIIKNRYFTKKKMQKKHKRLSTIEFGHKVEPVPRPQKLTGGMSTYAIVISIFHKSNF